MLLELQSYLGLSLFSQVMRPRRKTASMNPHNYHHTNETNLRNLSTDRVIHTPTKHWSAPSRIVVFILDFNLNQYIQKRGPIMSAIYSQSLDSNHNAVPAAKSLNSNVNVVPGAFS